MVMGSSILRLVCRKESAGILRRLDCRRMLSTNPYKTSPWLMLPPTFEKSRGGMVYNFYSLADDEVVQINKYGGGADPVESPDDDALVVGSSHGWLALMNRRNNDLYLSNPLSRRHIKLPPVDDLPHPEINLRRGWRGIVSKVILSGDGGAVMSFGRGDRLAFCRPGRSKEWTPIGDLFLEFEDMEDKFARCYEDFVYSSRSDVLNCLVLSGEGDVSLEDWDLRRGPEVEWRQKETLPSVQTGSYMLLPEVERFGYKWVDEDDEKARELHRCWWTTKQLVYVEQVDELFLIFRYVEKGRTTVGFTVARVEKDKQGGKVRLVGCDLDGFAVFVGTNHSFALSAQEFPHLKPNSIYFTDSRTYTYTQFEAGQTRGDIGIFDCAYGTFSSCYFPLKLKEEVNGPPTSSPIWFTPSFS